MSDLADLEPKLLWNYFLGLSRIPRGSKNETAAMAWVVDQAIAAGCEVERDAVGNALLRKKAAPGREDRPAIALQAHVDMVCEKNEGTPHDFAKDPIAVYRDGDRVRARGTTLGADNGIGVAAALAALAAKDVRHPALEVLVTIDEETGLTGANGLQPGWLRARRLLNLDSEEEGELTIGCAGGVDSTATRRVTRVAPGAGRKALRLKVSGLKGGHSGIDIGAGRGNAVRLLAEVLEAVVLRHDLQLASVRGGNKRNAIAREASAIVLVDPAREAALAADVARLAGEWRAALGALDPNLAVGLEPAQPEAVLSAADARAVVGLLLAGPHGVEAMSPDIAGLVQTSTNMGIVETHADRVEVNFLTRSAIDASKRALAARIAAVAALAGFEVSGSNGYPGWKPEPRSELVKLVDGVHEELFGKRMIVKAIHAGLECGLIGEKYPGMEMASIGPSMWDVHTPDEQVSIPSVQSFWRFLVGILERA
ncbi:aminoacyl-histidine dipeptidase [Anaeromyxobacter oryzae]|uniref:Aminoacyl-histidine dipeptidase n=1 Tax=Anaeromyxobacter oryzae TaxID=2918170 RepID=A0ABM7WNM1_9BACT|nr:aminoacyl-histidine dipeptidase [Anaeromyxobacter oryzae]BDG01069.1 aminoacyl-histidine dipeptidase [Anaeromyxobacter oryzae]